MKNQKSNSKKVFQPPKQTQVSTEKIPLNTLMRRFKSQDTYTISHKKNAQSIQKRVINLNNNTTANTQANANKLNTSPKQIKHFTSKNTPVSHKLTTNNSKGLITPTKMPKGSLSLNNNNNTATSAGIMLLSPYTLNQPSTSKDTLNTYNYLSSRPAHPLGMPIINLFNDESIQELDTEENINTLDDSKKCEYTISINDNSKTQTHTHHTQPIIPLSAKQNKFIDENIQIEKTTTTALSNYANKKKSRGKNTNLSSLDINQKNIQISLEEPTDFMFTQKDINANINMNISLFRQFLQMARKGDKEAFLEVFERVQNENNQMINYQDEQGLTALHYASDEGNLKIVEILIKGNADVNIKSKAKRTALHLSSHQGYFDISKLLIEKGAVINSQDNERNTPIHLCVMSQHIELLKYLLERYPQADSKNIYGKTPFDLASSNGNEDFKALISDYLKKDESRYHKIKIHNANNSQYYSMFNSNNMGNCNHGNRQMRSSQDLTPKEKGRGMMGMGLGMKYMIKSNLSEKKRNCHNAVGSMANNNNNQVQTNHININISANMCNVVNIDQDGSNSKKNLMNKEHNGSKGQTGIAISAKGISNKVITSYSKKTSSMGNQLTSPTKSLNQFLLSKGNSSKTKFDIAKSIKPVAIFSTNTNNNPPINNNLANCEIKIANVEINLAEIMEDKTNTNQAQIKGTENYKELNNDDDSLLTQNNNSTSNEEEKIDPNMFIIKGLLGKGSFGEVYLVEKKSTSLLYAMKVLNKKFIMGQNIVKYAMTERNILSITSHPFIVKLSYAFQTTEQLFLILDYCPGGDLGKHLSTERRFDENRAKIYLCEIILALGDLHRRDIIFRDLKPDNVVLDKDGHAMLTDFGLSKEGVFDGKNTKSFCGSVAYLAPEMLRRQGHGKAVDWYLLGVLFYEMLVGIPPYFTQSKEQIFKNIENANLQIPQYVSVKAKKLLIDLLQKNTSERLGTLKDIEDIKQHEYFNDVNWDEVYERKLKPPKPVLNNFISNNYTKPQFSEVNNSNSNNGIGIDIGNEIINENCTTSNSNSNDAKMHFDGWSFIQKDNHSANP